MKKYQIYSELVEPIIYADQIKIATLAYWRYIKQHLVGAIECKNADVLTINRSFMITESEVKVTISDMQRELKTKQYKHWMMNGGSPSIYPKANYFYFVVPEDLAQKSMEVCNERYPYAGLLIFRDGEIDIYKPQNIVCVKLARRFKREKPDSGELLEIAYGVSNTATRYISKYLEAMK